MRIVLTGADGFLGWHLRCRVRALTDHEIIPVGRRNWSQLPELCRDADAVIHVAGVNRAAPEALIADNVKLATDVRDAVLASPAAPRVVFANSIQAGNDSPYGEGKQRAAEILGDLPGGLVDVLLPNIFGEHGRPQYNSFVASFVDAVIGGQTPQITDRPIALLHAQQAAAALLDGVTGELRQCSPAGHETSVQGVWDLLQHFHTVYPVRAEIPALTDRLSIDLFNTYRSALFPTHYPIALTPHSDDRGWLVEAVKVHDGGGQAFVSTSKPGVTRGEHFHLGKIERFVVLAGQATIRLRKLFTDEVISFDVTGDKPAVIDMPTMWSHNITNTGESELMTVFWANELFDPDLPDTIAEKVR